MAEPPPPPPPPRQTQQDEENEGSNLPTTSRYPVLVSGQVSYTKEEAVKDIERVPTNVYRVQVELQPRSMDTNFSKAPWTLVARHFLSTIQLYDDTAIIIKKKENTIANKISSPEELPENPDDFERDYAYDVKLRSDKSVTFKILIGTKEPYWKTFREGALFKKLVANEWYVKYVRLENQGTVATIGHLLFAHNRYSNQEDVISEIRNLIYPVQCDQIDVRVTKSKEFYYEGNNKVRAFTKWLTIDCPVDIATKLSSILMEKWSDLQTNTKFENYNLKNTIYVPRNRGIVNFDARVENIGKQNEFLRNYKDVTVLSNVNNIDSTFRYTKEMGDIFEDESKVGQRLKLRSFLLSWKDYSTGKPAIFAIHRTINTGEYSLLSGSENMKVIHDKVKLFIEELSTQLGFTNTRVGGTKGTLGKYNHSKSITKYARDNFTSTKKFNQRPKSHEQGTDEWERKKKQQTENQWKTPPEINRKKVKETKASLIVNYNDQRLVQQFSDVVVGNSYQHNNNGKQQSEPTKGNNSGKTLTATDNNTVTIHEGHQIGTISKSNDTNKINQKTFQEIMETKQFQEILANAVAPQVKKQVSSIIAPTVEKISHIESQVGELNRYVRGNAKWQESQTKQQTTIQQDVTLFQQSMNQMQTTMNQMLNIFQDQKEKEGGTKRSAPTITQLPMISPKRKQKINNTPIPTSTPTEGSKIFDFELYDDMACNPNHSSQHTFSEASADDAMTQSDTAGLGEGQ